MHEWCGYYGTVHAEDAALFLSLSFQTYISRLMTDKEPKLQSCEHDSDILDVNF